ncbi:hypothetical protein MHYP_G00257520 [Metynnis hypsauchen]
MPDLSGVSRDYWDLKDVYSKDKAQVLPPHKELDCIINLLPEAGFFFVRRKDGGLRPCMDYRGLNVITIKVQHPLSIMSTAFEAQYSLSWTECPLG